MSAKDRKLHTVNCSSTIILLQLPVCNLRSQQVLNLVHVLVPTTVVVGANMGAKDFK